MILSPISNWQPVQPSQRRYAITIRDARTDGSGVQPWVGGPAGLAQGLSPPPPPALSEPVPVRKPFWEERFLGDGPPFRGSVHDQLSACGVSHRCKTWHDPRLTPAPRRSPALWGRMPHGPALPPRIPRHGCSAVFARCPRRCRRPPPLGPPLRCRPSVRTGTGRGSGVWPGMGWVTHPLCLRGGWHNPPPPAGSFEEGGL